MGGGVRGRFKREGTYVYLRLTHVVIWQKPAQHCKAIILQLKINYIYIYIYICVCVCVCVCVYFWLLGEASLHAVRTQAILMAGSHRRATCQQPALIFQPCDCATLEINLPEVKLLNGFR